MTIGKGEKGRHLRWKDGKGLRRIKTEHVLSEGERQKSEGGERVSRKKERDERGMEGKIEKDCMCFV